MLVLLLDAAILIGLFALFSGGDSLSWGKAILTGIAISLFSFACLHFLADAIGIWALLPCLFVAPPMLWLICDLPLKQSIFAGSIFTVYKIAFVFVIVMFVR